MTKQVNGYQDRVRREKSELQILIDRLDPFIGSAIYNALPSRERVRIMDQLYHMRRYHQILTSRIEWFDSQDA